MTDHVRKLNCAWATAKSWFVVQVGIGDAAFVLGRGGNRTATERGANAAAMIIKILLNRMGRDAFTRTPPPAPLHWLRMLAHGPLPW